MALSSSGLLALTHLDVYDTTQLAIDLDLETHKFALFNNTIANSLLTDTAYGVAPFDANEVTGTNWAAGGVALTGTTFTHSGGTLTFTASNISVASTTLSAIRGGLLYADALAGNNGILVVNFGGDYSTNSGTFAVTWSGSGIWTWDVTP